MNKYIAGFSVMVCVGLFSVSAQACECKKGSDEFISSFKESDTILAGKVRKIEPDPATSSHLKITLEVKEEFKGEGLKKGDSFVLYTHKEELGCGYKFIFEYDYMVYAYLSGKRYSTSACQRTKSLGKGLNDVKALRETRQPNWNYSMWARKYREKVKH